MIMPSVDGSGSTRVDPRTREAFGFEWLRYPVTTVEEDVVTLIGLIGVEPPFYDRVQFENIFSHQPSPGDVDAATTEYFHGKKVLEAGCGMGKYVRVIASQSAELVVGLDASDSVERACEITRSLPNVLIVQGDIFHPPLRGAFDFAYSVGVLHHTSAPRQAFLSVAGLVRPGGEMAVWLYPHARDALPLLLEIWHERLVRPLTSHLPHERLERLCRHLGRLTVFKSRLVRKGGVVRNGLARLLSFVAVGEHDDPSIAAFLNFDWYSPPYRSRHVPEELDEWFQAAGFSEPRFLPVDLSAIARADEDKQCAPVVVPAGR
jgi:SAM-dependent methyltransferase